VAVESGNAARRLGYHETLIPNSPVKPLRLWLEVGDHDNYYVRDGMHDWVQANENMRACWPPKATTTSSCSPRNAGHTDGATKRQTLPEALEYVWQGYTPVTR